MTSDRNNNDYNQHASQTEVAAITTHGKGACHMRRLLTLSAIAMLATSGGAALANPEAGNAFSQTIQPVVISSLDANIPKILRMVSIRCPAAGSLIVNADASFSISFNAGATSGTLHYAVS